MQFSVCISAVRYCNFRFRVRLILVANFERVKEIRTVLTYVLMIIYIGNFHFKLQSIALTKLVMNANMAQANEHIEMIIACSRYCENSQFFPQFANTNSESF